MRCFKIWDKGAKQYRTNHPRKGASTSVWSQRSTAAQVAGRLLGKGAYEIHTFTMTRSYVEGETE